MSSRLNLIMTSGLAMFAMFFGSGNLVFPIAIGVSTAGSEAYASIGLIITGILLPFLGLLAMILFNGERKVAFNYIGKYPALLLALAMLSLMSPFGVAARCILVAHGGVTELIPNISLWLFALIWCAVSAVIILRQHGWVSIVGRYLTPVLLVSLVVIIATGIATAPVPNFPPKVPYESFWAGLDQGYQTMDLLAAFFFSVSIVGYLKRQDQESTLKQTLVNSLAASGIGATLLALVYIGFVFLGGLYSQDLIGVAAEQRLAFVAEKTLGPSAAILVATAIATACLTTFIVLIVLFANFLKDELTHQKITYPIAVLITLLITYSVSLLGFNALALWIAGALQIAYPALIVFAISLIFERFTKVNLVPAAFWGALVVTAALSLI